MTRCNLCSDRHSKGEGGREKSTKRDHDGDFVIETKGLEKEMCV